MIFTEAQRLWLNRALNPRESLSSVEAAATPLLEEILSQQRRYLFLPDRLTQREQLLRALFAQALQHQNAPSFLATLEAENQTTFYPTWKSLYLISLPEKASSLFRNKAFSQAGGFLGWFLGLYLGMKIYYLSWRIFSQALEKKPFFSAIKSAPYFFNSLCALALGLKYLLSDNPSTKAFFEKVSYTTILKTLSIHYHILELAEYPGRFAENLSLSLGNRLKDFSLKTKNHRFEVQKEAATQLWLRRIQDQTPSLP